MTKELPIPPTTEFVGGRKELMNSERKDFQDKIRQLQEDLSLSHTKTLHSVTRIINTAKYLSDENKEQLLKEIWKL